ncbi:MAG: cytochrome c peroxidase [Pseudomonadota bacterium]
MNISTSVARMLVAPVLLVYFSSLPAALFEFTKEERAAIVQHGPWPPPLVRDTSNRYSGDSKAAQFGKTLFFDTRLSTGGQQNCASCHIPARAWSDGRATAAGHDETRRSTPSLLNARFNRWFGWSGAADSLWAASLRPLMDAREMGAAERHVAALMRSQPDLSRAYSVAFGRAPMDDDEIVIADLGKALAAFQETLVTGRTPFDAFRDALARGDNKAASRYPLAAQRGAKLFVGKAQCNVCHFGPTFSNGEFDKVGIGVRDANGYFDWGRYDGVKAVLASRYNRLSRHSDDIAGATSTRHVALDVEAHGAFKVPGLRHVALTAPYMHNGSLATLHDVVRHYSGITVEKLHIAAAHPHAEPGAPLPSRPVESVLRTLSLTAQEVDDLVAFLNTLTETQRDRSIKR